MCSEPQRRAEAQTAYHHPTLSWLTRYLDCETAAEARCVSACRRDMPARMYVCVVRVVCVCRPFIIKNTICAK